MKGEARKVKLLREEGYSYRQIAKILNLPLSTVYRLSKQSEKRGKKRGGKLTEYLRAIQENRELRDRLVELLLFTSEEKGTKRPLPYSKIWKEMELHLQAAGLSFGYHRFLQVLKAFIKAEFGGQAELEKLRRPKEAHRFRVSRGAVIREPELLEIDATGYTYRGVQYSMLFAYDAYTGFLFMPLVVENREKGATWYNRAFSSYDVALYLSELFARFGVPKAVRCDNEKILKSDLIKRGFEKLGIELKNTRPYNPNHKVIERAFRSLKEELRLHAALNKEADFIELLEGAVEAYNRSLHNFQHLCEPVIPHEVFTGYSKKLPELLVRNAFTLLEERTVRDNLIQIEGRIYRMVSPLGVKRKKVLVEISLSQAQEVSVYDASTGELVGIARLEGKPIEVSTVEVKEEKRQKAKLKRREKKLQQELSEIKREQSPIELEDLDSISLEEIPVQPTKEEQVSQNDGWLTLEDL